MLAAYLVFLVLFVAGRGLVTMHVALEREHRITAEGWRFLPGECTIFKDLKHLRCVCGHQRFKHARDGAGVFRTFCAKCNYESRD